jgi:hypothetical protein
VSADRGYDREAFRQIVQANNNMPGKPGRKNCLKPVEYAHERYKKRTYGKIKENRRLAIWHEKSALNFLAFILIVFLKISLCYQCLICQNSTLNYVDCVEQLYCGYFGDAILS